MVGGLCVLSAVGRALNIEYGTPSQLVGNDLARFENLRYEKCAVERIDDRLRET